MSAFIFACKEPKATRLRVVQEVEPTPATVTKLYDRLQRWNPSLGPDVIPEFYSESKKFWTVDDVGLLWSTVSDDDLEGHFVFWDGRLRGREALIHRMAQEFMAMYGRDSLTVWVPSARKMLLQFLFRCSFFVDYVQGDLCKVKILREV